MGNADHHHQSAARSHKAAEGAGAGPGHTGAGPGHAHTGAGPGHTGAGPGHAHTGAGPDLTGAGPDHTGAGPDHTGAGPGYAHTHGTGEADEAAMAELLDLDAEVLHSYLSEVTAWVHDLAAGGPHQLILDLGSGTGTGALALAQRFSGAEVTAVDKSAYFLGRLGEKARDLGVAGRVRTVEADLDAAWPAIGPVDLVWASNSLHHMADPDRVLTDLFGALRPGGLLVAAELGSFPRFLPDDIGLGRPGLEARCHAALAEAMAAEVPHLGSDWGPRLSKAGFTIEAERLFPIGLTAPLPAATGRYAQGSLRRMRGALDGLLAADDLAALDTLIDGDGPGGVLRRDDLTVRATRTVWAARRP